RLPPCRHRSGRCRTPRRECALDRGQDRPAVSLRLRILPVSLLGLLYTLRSYHHLFVPQHLAATARFWSVRATVSSLDGSCARLNRTSLISMETVSISV